MVDLLFVVTNASALVTMNVFALKIRNILFVQAHEKIIAPILSGLASTIMLLLPVSHYYITGDLRSLPIFMAGLRFGWQSALLASLFPALFSLSLKPDDVINGILLQLVLPAVVSSLHHRRSVRSGYETLMWKDGLRSVTIVFALYLLFGYSFVHANFSSWLWQTSILFLVSLASLLLLVYMYNDDCRNWLMQRRLELMANQDVLTGLPNLRNLLEVSENNTFRKPISVFMIDIDHFKNFNDRVGHLEGDNLLKKVALIMKHAIGETDYIARYGGEEFVLLSQKTGEQELEDLAMRICTAVAKFPFKNREVQPFKHISVSIGITISASSQTNIIDLMAEADAALYEVKKNGRNGYLFYRPQFLRKEQKENNA